jgi:predicted dehydrogenase
MTTPTKSIGRRDFLKATTALTAFFIVPRNVLGKGYVAPSDKLHIGVIGTGKQSGGLIRNFLATGEVAIPAACDVYDTKLQNALSQIRKLHEEKGGKASADLVKGYKDFREILQRKDIDGVIIATPDHWHASIAVKSAEAGKDIYCEKPLSLTIPEGRAMVNATRKYNRVFQTGSMQRSAPEFTKAVQLVRTGAIGKIQKIYVSVGGPPKKWDLDPEATPAGLDWDFWMGPNTIARPFSHRLAPRMDADFWADWRSYDEFGGGMMTDWGAHMFDIAQWGLNMDHSGPVEVIHPGGLAEEGIIYRYENGVEVIHRPQKGSNHCHFIGTEGEVKVARGKLVTTPDSLNTKVFSPSDTDVYVSTNHYKDFIQAIKTRKKPICDVEIGHRTASMCTIGNISYRLQRSLKWNPTKEDFIKDKEASKLLSRSMKKEWKV